jgi:hypothetical protein
MISMVRILFMVRTLNDLTGSTLQFACYCAEQCSIADLVSFASNGIDYDMCEEWGVNGEQWQDAIFAALEVLRHQD